MLRLKLRKAETWPKDLDSDGALEARKKISMAGPGGSKTSTAKGPSQTPNPKRQFTAQTPVPKMWEAIKKVFKGTGVCLCCIPRTEYIYDVTFVHVSQPVDSSAWTATWMTLARPSATPTPCGSSTAPSTSKYDAIMFKRMSVVIHPKLCMALQSRTR